MGYWGFRNSEVWEDRTVPLGQRPRSAVQTLHSDFPNVSLLFGPDVQERLQPW